MFDIAPTEFLLVAFVALVVIGPKDLPKAMRFVGRWVGKARGVARQFRSGFDAMVREAELEEMEKRWASENERIMREHSAEPADSDKLLEAAPPSQPVEPDQPDADPDQPDLPLMVEKPVVAPADAEPKPVSPRPRAKKARGQGSVVSDEVEDLDGSKAPLLDHLIELRRRLLYCIAALVVGFGVSYYFAEDIFAFLVQPLLTAGQKTVIYTQIFEAFFVKVKVAFFAAMMIAFPVIANQLWQFVAPGLYKKERRALLPFLFATPVLFGLGASMAYFLAIPMALHFLLSFQGNIGGINQQALPAIGNYLSFTMQFLFGFGLAFLLPILLMLLERAGVVTRRQLISARRYAIVGAFAVAAVLTPPDVGSQLLLAIPLVLLYEISIWGIWLTERKRARDTIPVSEV